jgi:hypothetical protein
MSKEAPKKASSKKKSAGGSSLLSKFVSEVVGDPDVFDVLVAAVIFIVWLARAPNDSAGGSSLPIYQS